MAGTGLNFAAGDVDSLNEDEALKNQSGIFCGLKNNLLSLNLKSLNNSKTLSSFLDNSKAISSLNEGPTILSKIFFPSSSGAYRSLVEVS